MLELVEEKLEAAQQPASDEGEEQSAPVMGFVCVKNTFLTVDVWDAQRALLQRRSSSAPPRMSSVALEEAVALGAREANGCDGAESDDDQASPSPVHRLRASRMP